MVPRLTFENGAIVEYDPIAAVASLYMGLDEAAIFTGVSQSNADVDALHAVEDGSVIFSIRTDGVGRIGNDLVYGFADTPSGDLFQLDPVSGEAQRFLDGAGLFDGAERNLDAVSFSARSEPSSGPACGLGVELLLPTASLAFLLGRTRRRR